MFQIVKVIKVGQKSSRVLLDDSRSVRVPNSIVTLGFIGEEDIKKIETAGVIDYVHISFYKPPRERVEPVYCRDMSQFDATKELKLLKGILLKNLFVLGRTLSEEELDDMTEDCFLHFWERKLFQRYNQDKLRSYNSYLSRAVRNYLIDLKRNSHYYHDTYHKSLDQNVKGDEGSTLGSLIPSDFSLEDDSLINLMSSKVKEMIQDFRQIVLKLDSEESTGLTFTYIQIFDSLFIHNNYRQFVSDSGYSLSTVNTRKQFMLDMLYPTYKEYMYA